MEMGPNYFHRTEEQKELETRLNEITDEQTAISMELERLKTESMKQLEIKNESLDEEKIPILKRLRELDSIHYH